MPSKANSSRRESDPHYLLLSLHAGATLLSAGRPKKLPQRVAPDDDATAARWARGAWRGWRSAGADTVGVARVNPGRGKGKIALDGGEKRRPGERA